MQAVNALDLLPPVDIAALIFDWDGTLVDTHEAGYRALSATVAQYGLSVDREWYWDRLGLSSPDTIRELLDRHGAELDVDELVAERDHNYYTQELHRIRVFPCMRDLIAHESGWRHFAVVTVGPWATLEPSLQFLRPGRERGRVLTPGIRGSC